MTVGRLLAMALLVAPLLGGCGLSRPSSVPGGNAAYQAIPVRATESLTPQPIRAGDRLAIDVFGEPELSSDKYRVDNLGYLQLPLIGEMPAAGQSPSELREEIARRLSKRYLRSPQVTVAVMESVQSSFAIEGAVKDPGVYAVDPSTTLLAAIARAKSPTEIAKLDEVLIFRTVGGQRMGGRFDLREIRAGQAADPQILAGDTIVVGLSDARSIYRDILQSAPLFNLFYVLK